MHGSTVYMLHLHDPVVLNMASLHRNHMLYGIIVHNTSK